MNGTNTKGAMRIGVLVGVSNTLGRKRTGAVGTGCFVGVSNTLGMNKTGVIGNGCFCCNHAYSVEQILCVSKATDIDYVTIYVTIVGKSVIRSD